MLRALKETLGYDIKAVLQYRASRDGWDAKDYHRFCDNNGPTITLIMTTNDVLCGGFLNIPITSEVYNLEERMLDRCYKTPSKNGVLPRL